MSNKIPVPTLSTSGWVNSSSEKIDFLLAHFYESEKSQTFLYGNNVTSIQYIVQKYGNDITAFNSNLKLALENYLGRHYDSVNVTITDNNNSSNLNGAINFSIYCEVTEDGVTNSAGRLLETVNSKLIKFTNLNNG